MRLASSRVLAAPGGLFAMCSRILWNTNQLAVVVSRTMDWPGGTDPKIAVFPRGVMRNGSLIDGFVAVAGYPANWTSRYGSMVTTAFSMGAADGFNECGLGAHLLYLKAADFGPRDASRPGLQATLWAQFVLDNAATVEEALAVLETVQLVLAEPRGYKTTVHLAIEDSRGDSAIIEYVGGKPVTHHGDKYRIMTNDPIYDKQLELLKKLDLSKPSSSMPLPGNVRATDRFQRAAYYAALLPEPKNEREAIAAVLAIARNVSIPFGAPYAGVGIYNTEYRTAINLSKKRYFFELSTSPNVIWVDLSKFDLSRGSPVMMLNPDNVELSGNVTESFEKVAMGPF
jgi:penicillin V acylase-like amidase (Ntn superfamily)